MGCVYNDVASIIPRWLCDWAKFLPIVLAAKNEYFIIQDTPKLFARICRMFNRNLMDSITLPTSHI
jgi:hypothetical protein